MAHVRTWFLVIVIAMMSYCVLGEYVTCDGLTCVMKTDKSYYEVDKFGARMYLLDPSGVPRKELTQFGIGFSHLIEREKNVTNAQMNQSRCYTSNQDPLLNYKLSNGDYFGEIRQLFVISELITYVTVKNDYPVPGIHTASFVSYFGPTPIIEIVYSLSTINLNITLSNDTAHTGGFIAQETYRENSLKLGLNIFNYPWAAPSTGQNYTESFVTVYLNTTYKYTEGDMIVAVDGQSLDMVVTNDILGYGLQYILDYFYIIDGVPYLANANSSTEVKNLNGALLPSQSYFNLNVCPNQEHSEIGHFSSVVYDPSIGVLFSNFPASDEAQSEPAKKSRQNTMIALYVIVPLVIVGLVAAVLIIIFVPSVYNVVLSSDPFKRNGKSKAYDTVGSKNDTKSASAPILAPEHASLTASASTSSPPASTSSSSPGSTSWTAIQKPPRE